MSAKLTNDMLHLIWDNHLENIASLFKTLYDDNSLVDVTLSCRDGDIKAHKLVLSACSPYFQRIFSDNPHPHPVVILRGVRHCEMIRLVEFMYKGFIDVPAPLFVNLMHIANDLEIKGFERFSNGHNGDYDNITSHSNSITVETVKISQNATTAKKPNENGAVSTPQVVRDTRYHGRKRVAVDYSDDEEMEGGRLDRKSNNIRISIEKNTDERKNAIAEENVTIISNKNKSEVDNHKLKSQRNSNSQKNTENENTGEEIDGTTISDSYTCSICSMSFKSKDVLIEHIECHNQPEKSFKCKMYSSSFKRSAHLSKSKLFHMGERPFYCDLCGKDFSRLNKLRNHIRLNHEVQSVNSLSLSKSNSHDTEETDKKNVSTECEKQENRKMYEAAFLHELQLQQVHQKRGRGRPRKYSSPSPILVPKRRRGRPKGSRNYYNKSAYDEGNYDVTNLPYGDLHYLTMPETQKSPSAETTKEVGLQERSIESSSIKVEEAPLQNSDVEITMLDMSDKTATEKIDESREIIMNHENNIPMSELPIIIEPYIEITADDTALIDPSNASQLLNPFYSDPSLQAIGQIGECTVISLTQQST